MVMSDWSEILDANADSLGRALAETALDFVCLATSHGEPFYLNPAGRRLLGLGEDQPASSISLRECYADESWTELRDVAGPAVNKTAAGKAAAGFASAHRRVHRRGDDDAPRQVERGRPARLSG